MLSTADGSACRRLLLTAALAGCLFASLAMAQTSPVPCEMGPVLDFTTAAGTESPIQRATTVPCGGAGQPCCPVNSCNIGLVCNSNGICRTPCGGAGERCCPNQTCDNPSLACNSNGVCRTCGGDGNICCAGNTCSSGLVCSGGRCTSPCGGPNQACCNGGFCLSGGTCDFGTNRCVACGQLFQVCCVTSLPQCFVGTCQSGLCQ
jgi:hypothetical protein